MARKLVLFDFDGTLVDTAPDLVRTTNLFLKSYGQPELSEKRIREEIGYGLKNLMLEVFPQARHDLEHFTEIEQRFLSIYEEEMIKSPRAFEGALDFLTKWPGSVGIVSNKRERHIHPILKQLGMDTLPWTAIIGGDTFDTMKPHPKPLLEAMKAAGRRPDETVMVGDGEPDVEGALAVGIPSIAVGFGYAPLEKLRALGATAVIQHFRELPKTIENLAS